MKTTLDLSLFSFKMFSSSTRLAVTQVLPTLCSLDGAPASVTQKLAERTEFEEMCLSQAQQETSLRNSHEAALV